MRPLRAALLMSTVSLLTAGTAAVPTASAAPDKAPAGAIPGRYIVVLHDRVADVATVAADHGRRYGARSEHVYSAALRGYSAAVPDARLAALKADPRVAFVTPDRPVSVAAVALRSGETVPVGLRRIGAATSTTTQPAATGNVAVIDTGVQLKHPDLNVVSGKTCVSGTRNANDDNGHGTHVAGTIAARNNGSGLVGVVPGTKIYAVKVLDSAGSGTTSRVICGIDWVTANAAKLNIRVANMSLGGSGASDGNCGNTSGDAKHKAICRSVGAGVHYVVAAGNSATDLATKTPAAYPEVLTVTAMTDSDGVAGGLGAAPSCRTSERDDTYASFSNYATTTADAAHTIAAPGVCITSTWLSGSYRTISGTSMAAPHVAGVVALCLGTGGATGACTGLTPAQVIQKLRNDAQASATSSNGFLGDPLQPVSGRYYGHLADAARY